MYFDDIYMEDIRPATQVSEYVAKIIEFCLQDSHISEEVEKERENFFGSNPELYYPTSEERELAEIRFTYYFIFSYTSRYYKKTPLEVFLSSRFSKLSQKEAEIYSGFMNSIYSGFEVLKVVPGSYLIIQDLSSGRVYKVRENKGTYQMDKGDFIVARLFPYDKDYALGEVSLFLPENIAYLPKREWRRMSPRSKEELNPLLLEKMIYQAGRKKESSEEVERKLRKLLKKYFGKKAPSIKQLRRKINQTTDPLIVLNELTEKINFSTPEEYMEFYKVFNLFWNLSPRDEFGGKSPAQMMEDIGPREEELRRDFLSYLASQIDPEEFSSEEELEKKIEECKERWLSEPQRELNGRTPREVILEERRKRDNPRKDFSLKVKIQPIIVGSGIKRELDGIGPEDTPLVEDMESFVEYLQCNKVKVTPRNKWIPFKHLKMIEENFKYKDSFTCLGREEKRGEEPRKRYINFIDSMCRAGGFIYLDDKDKIRVNKDKIDKFKKKSYGERLFELLCIWLEKVDWKNLQTTFFRDYYCDVFQENFQAILYHLYHLKPNEKTTPEEFICNLYAPARRKIRFQGELLTTLVIDLSRIVLDYLKWLGIVKIEGVEVIEGGGTFSIRKFWVTPVGKNLIDELVRYFIKKGKIKI